MRLSISTSFLTLPALLLLPAYLHAEEEDPKPINIETINTEWDESDPHASSDSMTLYYSSNSRKKLGVDERKLDIRVGYRSSKAKLWSKGKPIGGYVETRADDASIFVTHWVRGGNQYLFYATTKDKEQGNYDIYSLQKLGPRAAFTVPTFHSKISTAADEMHPWLTSDGRHLFFSRKTKDGWRVFIASRNGHGLSGFTREPQMIESLPANFYHATLSPNASVMYLQGPLEKGRWGIFVSKREDGKWSKPAPLNINHEEGEVGAVAPNLSRDGKWLYFASDRPGGKGKLDVYIISVAKLKVKE